MCTRHQMYTVARKCVLELIIPQSIACLNELASGVVKLSH